MRMPRSKIRPQRMPYLRCRISPTRLGTKWVCLESSISLNYEPRNLKVTLSRIVLPLRKHREDRRQKRIPTNKPQPTLVQQKTTLLGDSLKLPMPTRALR